VPAVATSAAPQLIATLAEDDDDAPAAAAAAEGDADAAAATEAEPQLISEVQITGLEEYKDLERLAWSVVQVRPNLAVTNEDVQEDANRLFDTGYFNSVSPVPEDTRDGVRLKYEITPYPVMKKVVVYGATEMPPNELQRVLNEHHGQMTNLNLFDVRKTVQDIDQWYMERGLFGQVHRGEGTAVEFVGDTLSVEVEEGIVRNVHVKFLDRETGNPVPGRTKLPVILRNVLTRPGKVYSLVTGQRDITRVQMMECSEDVNMIPSHANENSSEIDLTLNVTEKRTSDLNAGFGTCPSDFTHGFLSGLIGQLDFSQKNLGGRNQKLNGKMELGKRKHIFRLIHTDPWIEGDRYKTSRTVSIQKMFADSTLVHAPASPGNNAKADSASASASADGGAAQPSQASDPAAAAAATEPPKEARAASAAATGAVAAASSEGDPAAGGDAGGALASSAGNGGAADASGAAAVATVAGELGAASAAADSAAPVAEQPAGSPTKQAPTSKGFRIQREEAAVEFSRHIHPFWEGTLGLSFQRAGPRNSEGPCLEDEYGSPLTVSGRAFDDALVLKAEAVHSSDGHAQAVLSSEQSLPLPGMLSFTRLRMQGSRAFMWRDFTFSAFGQCGSVRGDLPPYDAFLMGGTNSVRGYDEGALGSGSRFAVGTVELQKTLPQPLQTMQGVVFADYGTDMGSGAEVLGDPAGKRGKPGTGYGYGVGLRVDSPLGPLRFEFAWNDKRRRKYHFGIGYRF